MVSAPLRRSAKLRAFPPASVACAAAHAPPHSWLFGHLPEMKRDILGFFARCERDFGAVVPLRLYTIPFFLVNDPALIQRILVTDNATFIKPTGLKAVKPMFGEGLLTADGEHWRSQRALIQPAFHKQRIDRYADVIAESTRTMLDSWEESATRDAYSDMSALTLDIVARALFGVDFAAGRAAVLAAAQGIQDFFLSWRRHYLPGWLPLPEQWRLRGAVRKVDRAIYELIAARETQRDRTTDLLSVLLDTARADGSKMSPRAVRDELVTLFLAGHETSAVALSWALYELARHRTVAAKLRDELDRALGGRAPTARDLPDLPYLDHVVKEALRLYPSAYNLGRVAKEAYSLGEYTVAAGQNVIICPWAVQRSHRYYDEPDAFTPERWVTERARSLPKFAYFPFSGGPRSCIGAQFALLEMKLVLATAIQRYEFDLEASANITVDAAMTLRPTGGIPMRVGRRVALADGHGNSTPTPRSSIPTTGAIRNKRPCDPSARS